MKYLILVGDGMGDLPRDELGGKTVLEAANTPNMDRLAREGLLGLAQTIPSDKQPGSDTANMSLMGYDPAVYHTGRSPIEAAAMGVDLAPDDIAFRCNLVTLDRVDGKVIMADYAAGHIDDQTAEELILALDAELGKDGLRFHPGVSYRHLLVWRDGPVQAATVPPHDRTGQPVDDVLAEEGDLGRVTDLTRLSWHVLRNHPANARRAARGKSPATSIWLWGQGTKPAYDTWQDRYGLSGVVISAVDLVRGLGLLSGLTPVIVEGATGLWDTNYEGKVAAALEGLAEGDVAFVHFEGPDEAGHSGNLEEKTKAIELFDARAVGPLLEGLAKLGPHRVLLATDHYTPLSIKTHSRQPVPFVLWDSAKTGPGGAAYNEPAAQATGVFYPRAYKLAKSLVEGW